LPSLALDPGIAAGMTLSDVIPSPTSVIPAGMPESSAMEGNAESSTKAQAWLGAHYHFQT
jgi:hypothetical protein